MNLYIVYELNNWPGSISNNFLLKNCLFGTVKLVINPIKSKFTYNGLGISFEGKDSWSFGSTCARNVVIFDVDNTSSCQIDNQKNYFLVLGEGPTFEINDSFGIAEKKISINFSKGKTQFCLSLHYNGVNSYLYVNKTR